LTDAIDPRLAERAFTGQASQIRAAQVPATHTFSLVFRARNGIAQGPQKLAGAAPCSPQDPAGRLGENFRVGNRSAHGKKSIRMPSAFFNLDRAEGA
jgi:hypothetical protein